MLLIAIAIAHKYVPIFSAISTKLFYFSYELFLTLKHFILFYFITIKCQKRTSETSREFVL